MQRENILDCEKVVVDFLKRVCQKKMPKRERKKRRSAFSEFEKYSALGDKELADGVKLRVNLGDSTFTYAHLCLFNSCLINIHGL